MSDVPDSQETQHRVLRLQVLIARCGFQDGAQVMPLIAEELNAG